MYIYWILRHQNSSVWSGDRRSACVLKVRLDMIDNKSNTPGLGHTAPCVFILLIHLSKRKIRHIILGL